MRGISNGKLAVAAVAAAVVAVAAGSALASRTGGSQSIASAPELPIGSHVVSSTPNKWEFWRLTAGIGDRVVIDFETLTRCHTGIFIYAAGVTDYTIEDASSLVSDYTGDNGKHELSWTATSGGRLVLQVYGNGCNPTAYGLTAYVKRMTHVVVSAPKVISARHTLHVKGRVDGASGGKVVLKLTSRSAAPRRVVVPIAGNGAFAWSPRIGAPGSYVVAAVFYGDSTHRGSKAATSVKVV